MNNRDIMFQNYQAGAFNTPTPTYVQPQYIMPVQPSGYVTNTQYQAFGPNVVPEQIVTTNDNIDLKINQIERRILNLETRVRDLELKLSSTTVDTIDNTYII